VHMLKDTSPPSKRRSRITSGARLLPTVRGDSQWGRIMGDVYNSALAHCGGADYVSELQRLQCRRIGALEAELVHAENRIAAARTAGEEPPPSLLDLYCRLSSAQRRHCEALGWQRTARDITPDLRKYIEQKSADTRVGGRSEGAALPLEKACIENPILESSVSESPVNSPVSDFQNPESPISESEK
jgi:hypothetical protein